MSLDLQVQALRSSAILTSLPHLACLRLSGEGAFDAVDRLCPAELFLRDGQILHTLLLDPQGRPFADLYLCCEDQSYVLIADGPSAAELLAHVREHAPKGAALQLEDLSQTHEVISVDGPYAWEVLAGLVGQEVIGVPYLSFFRGDGWTCYRAGKTGEYGYLFLVPREAAPLLRQRLQEIGKALDLAEGSLAALDVASLENWFFNIRREGKLGLSPLELQLQWRISYRKEYVGSEALRARRAQGISRRVCCLAADGPAAPGLDVRQEGEVVGVAVAADRSPTRGDFVVLALLTRRWAHPGISGFEVNGARARSVSPPLVNNRSLFVNPQKDSYRTRAGQSYPPLVTG